MAVLSQSDWAMSGFRLQDAMGVEGGHIRVHSVRDGFRNARRARLTVFATSQTPLVVVLGGERPRGSCADDAGPRAWGEVALGGVSRFLRVFSSLLCPKPYIEGASAARYAGAAVSGADADEEVVTNCVGRRDGVLVGGGAVAGFDEVGGEIRVYQETGMLERGGNGGAAGALWRLLDVNEGVAPDPWTPWRDGMNRRAAARQNVIGTVRRWRAAGATGASGWFSLFFGSFAGWKARKRNTLVARVVKSRTMLGFADSGTLR